MAKKPMDPELLASLMGSSGPDVEEAQRSAVMSVDPETKDWNITRKGEERIQSAQPITEVHVSEKYRAVPINAPGVYAGWRAKQKNVDSVPHWHELPGAEQVNWQQSHPEGRKLTQQAIAAAKANPEAMLDQKPGSVNSRNTETRNLVRNLVAEPNTDPADMSTDTPVPLRQRFEKQGELLTGKYVAGGAYGTGPESLDPTPEVSLGRAWVAHLTSRPEIGMALHDDPSHHENMRNAVDSLMQDHAQTVGGVSHGSEVAKHGRLALEAVARSARAHSLGMKATALANMSQAVRHINDLSMAVKGAKMSAGVPVAATPSPEVMNAGKAYGAYNASVANVKGLPE